MTAAASTDNDLVLTGTAGTASGPASTLGGDVAPLYRSGDLVFVRPLRAVLWVAQLTEPVVEIAPGEFNTDRPNCRYFVITAELGAFPHALEWWQGRGESLQIADEDEAMARAGRVAPAFTPRSRKLIA